MSEQLWFLQLTLTVEDKHLQIRVHKTTSTDKPCYLLFNGIDRKINIILHSRNRMKCKKQCLGIFILKSTNGIFLRIVEDSDERLLYHKCCSKNIQTRSIVFCQQLIFNQILDIQEALPGLHPFSSLLSEQSSLPSHILSGLIHLTSSWGPQVILGKLQVEQAENRISQMFSKYKPQCKH